MTGEAAGMDDILELPKGGWTRWPSGPVSSGPERVRWLVGVGSNLGGREEQVARLGKAVRRVLTELQTYAPWVVGASALYETNPWGEANQPVFLNGAVCLDTASQLQPRELLKVCKQVEEQMGRQIRQRWGPRELDLDILLMHPGHHASPDLLIPHRDLHRRMFALIPAHDLGWNSVHAIAPEPAWQDLASTMGDESPLPPGCPTVDEVLCLPFNLEQALPPPVIPGREWLPPESVLAGNYGL